MVIGALRCPPLFRLARERAVIQLDQRKWDYKHQVLATRFMVPWRVLAWVKTIKVIMHVRPRALWRLSCIGKNPARISRSSARCGVWLFPPEVARSPAVRPRALWRLATHRDRAIRRAMGWYYEIGLRVLRFEIGNFLRRDQLQTRGPSLQEFWGAPQNAEENALRAPARGGKSDAEIIPFAAE